MINIIRRLIIAFIILFAVVIIEAAYLGLLFLSINYSSPDFLTRYGF